MSRRARSRAAAIAAKHVALEPLDDDTDTEGPAGTYGCACMSRDPAECHRMRYGIVAGDVSHGAEDCDCLCHTWSDGK